MRGLTEFKLRRTVKMLIPAHSDTLGDLVDVVLVPRPFPRAPSPSAAGIAAAVLYALRKHKPHFKGKAVRITIAEVRACRACACTEDNACDGGCWWVESDLCSSCSPSTAPEALKAQAKRARRQKAVLR